MLFVSDLGLFSTKTLVEANPDHQVEVRTQVNKHYFYLCGGGNYFYLDFCVCVGGLVVNKHCFYLHFSVGVGGWGV